MATSGTFTFNPDVISIIEEAYSQAGVKTLQGYDLKQAARALNLTFADIANRGIHLWLIESISLAMVADTASYTLEGRVQDVLQAVLRTTATDIDIEMVPMGRTDYWRLTDKTQTGQPVSWYLDRQRDAPVMYLWPVPNASSTWTVRYNAQVRVEDVGAFTNTLDIPYRFIPMVCSGLAYRVGLTHPEQCDLNRLAKLEINFERELTRAEEEDREKVPWTIRLERRR